MAQNMNMITWAMIAINYTDAPFILVFYSN